MRRLLIGLVLGAGPALATPLMTPDHPLWVQDAVRSLRQRGLVSAGCLPDEALRRGDVGALLQRFADLEKAEQQNFATQADLGEVRRLLEALMEESNRLDQRTEAIHPPQP